MSSRREDPGKATLGLMNYYVVRHIKVLMLCPKSCCVESVSFLGMGSEAIIGNITIHPIAAKPSSPLRMRPAASEDFRRANEEGVRGR
jgi:hypothetical protein